MYEDAFNDHPSLASLQRLLDAVDDNDRDQRLDAAIETVRQRVTKPPKGQSWVHNDVLVEIPMWARRHDDAWEAAKAGGCNPRRWMDLAAAREAGHPIDAIDISGPQVIRSIEAKNNQGYANGIELMTRIHRLADPPEPRNAFKTSSRLPAPPTNPNATSKNSSTNKAGDSPRQLTHHESSE